MILLNPNQGNTPVAIVPAHEENKNGMQTLSDTVKSTFVKLSTQKEALQKEVTALKAQLIAKKAAHEAERKSMQELIGTMRKEMENLFKRIGDLEHVAKEHSHDSTGQPMIQIGTKNIPNLVPVEKFHVLAHRYFITVSFQPDGTVRVENVYGPIQFPLKASKG